MARAALLGVVLSASLSGCAGPGKAERSSKLDEVELQEGVERVATVLMARITQAMEPLAAPEAPPQVRALALRQALLYHSSIVDIATGRFPQVNVLDLLAFIDLASATVAEYWGPRVFGAGGRPLQDALARSAQDAEQLARQVLTRAQVDEVHQLVLDWRRENLGQLRVEEVRLFGFAEAAGKIAGARTREARGLLSAVKRATRSADQAVLLGERAMFLAVRVPFLLRLQARLGALQLLEDGMVALRQADAMLQRSVGVRPLLGEATTLARQSGQVVRDARALVDALQPLLRPPREGDEALRAERLVASASGLVGESSAVLARLDDVEAVLAAANRLTDRSTALLRDARALLPTGPVDPIAAAARQADELVRRWLVDAAVVGALLIVTFWGGYVVARGLTRDRGRSGSAADRQAPQEARR